MAVSKGGARQPLHPAAPVERHEDVATAVVELLKSEASGNPEAAKKKEADERSKHVHSSLFLSGAGSTAALLGRNNVPRLFSLVKRFINPICK
jgi:hypothetical protein